MALISGTQLRSHVGAGQIDDYLNEHGTQLHGALATHYDSQRAQLPPRRATDAITSDFSQILHRYETVLSNKTAKKPSALQHVSNWDEVILAAQQAQEQYVNDAKGAKGSVRRLFRWTGDHSNVLVDWVGLLPNDKYFAILCGGLTLVLNAAARRRERREQILDAFADLPEVVLKTQKYHKLFPKDLVLRDRALAVYLALLSMIEAMIASLVDSSMWRQMKDGLKGTHADRPLEEKIKESKKSIQALQDQIDYLQTSTLVATNDTVSRIYPRLADIEQSMRGTQRLNFDIRDRTSAIQDSISGVDHNIGLIQHDMSRQLEETIRVNRQLDSSVEATKNIMAVLKGVLHFAEWKSDQIVSQVKGLLEQNRPRPILQWTNSRETIANLLATDDETVSRDLSFIQRQSQSIEEPEQRRALWLFQSHRFQEWLCSTRTDMILVEGNSDTYGMARYSALSLISSVLATELSGNGISRAISFFCGLHNVQSDDLAGPQGLIRSLISQLLNPSDMNCDVQLSNAHLDALSRHDLSALCSLFHQLLTRLPHSGNILFCIIDGISLFELDPWLEYAYLLVSRLADIVTDPRVTSSVKIILTAPGTSRHLKNHIDGGNKIWIPRDASASAGANSRIEGVGRSASSMLEAGFDGQMGRGGSSRLLGNVPDEDDIYEFGCVDAPNTSD